jgi:hypothetical protein
MFLNQILIYRKKKKKTVDTEPKSQDAKPRV